MCVYIYIYVERGRERETAFLSLLFSEIFCFYSVVKCRMSTQQYSGNCVFCFFVTCPPHPLHQVEWRFCITIFTATFFFFVQQAQFNMPPLWLFVLWWLFIENCSRTERGFVVARQRQKRGQRKTQLRMKTKQTKPNIIWVPLFHWKNILFWTAGPYLVSEDHVHSKKLFVGLTK